jgi:hypothetical protein
MIKNVEATSPFRTGCPFSEVFHPQISMAKMRRRALPLSNL